MDLTFTYVVITAIVSFAFGYLIARNYEADRCKSCGNSVVVRRK